MKYILTFMILALCGTFASAQTDEKAKAILDKTVGQIKSYPAVEIVFDLSMINKEENIQETHPGKAYMKDNMYRIDVMDEINYFDGEVIYTYMPDQEEVNIKNPDENEEEMLNPSILFDIHNQKFTQKLVEDKDGKAYIELTPKKEHKQISKIGVWINTKTNTVEKVSSFGKDGNDVVITIKSLKKPEKELDINFFRFDKEAHPEVDIVDLR